MSTRTFPKPRWETPEPKGIVGTYGKAVRAWGARELGLTLDGWQGYALDRALRYDRHGDLLARIVLLGTARQAGKSVVVRSLFGWLLDEGRELPAFEGWTTLLAAAHDAKQARIVYRGVYSDLASIPRLRDRARGGPRHFQDVRLTDYFGITVGRLTLDTVTGQPGSARGLSAGAIAWDEVLTQKDYSMWEALSPTQSAQRSPIMLLTSTAGHSDSVLLRMFYDKLRRQAAGDEKPDPTFYGAWWQSDDADAGLDWKQIRQATPSMRVSKQAITTEYGILPPDSWRRERLNHFVDIKADGAFNPGVWAACRVEEPLDGLSGPYALGIDVHHDWKRATITVGGIRPDGRVGIEVYRDLRGTDRAPVRAADIVALVHAFPDIDAVTAIAYDGVSGAAPSFRRDMESSGLPWDELKPAAVVSACMDTDEMIRAGRLAVDDPLLDAQVAVTVRRNVGQDGMFRFNRQASLGPIDAVYAMTFAAHAIAYTGPQPKIT